MLWSGNIWAETCKDELWEYLRKECSKLRQQKVQRPWGKDEFVFLKEKRVLGRESELNFQSDGKPWQHFEHRGNEMIFQGNTNFCEKVTCIIAESEILD